MFIRNSGVLLSAGMIGVALSIILNRFAGDTAVSHFLQGMFIGIAIVLLPAALFKMRRGGDNRPA